jgi:hypothetical protein
MIISKNIEMKVSNNSINYYKNFGYKNIKQGDLIIIPIELLSKSSRALIKVKCDCCEEIYDIKYGNYNSRKREETFCKKCSDKNNGKILIDRNTIDAKCDYCGEIISVKKSKYNRNVKTNGKFSCKKCGPDKYRETCLEKYGVDNIIKLSKTHDKIKHTCLKKHGNENYRNTEQRDKTILNREGGYSSIIEKYKQTCLERFGVENASQCPEIFAKQQKRRYEIHQFRDTDIFYQGTYEKDFLDKYYDKVKITKIKEIDYVFENKNKKYFSDYYIPKFNLIVEVKSSYTYERYEEQNMKKEKSCIDLEYNFIFIIDKKYSELEKIIYKL